MDVRVLFTGQNEREYTERNPEKKTQVYVYSKKVLFEGLSKGHSSFLCAASSR